METKAPAGGYVISNELKNGKVITITEGTTKVNYTAENSKTDDPDPEPEPEKTKVSGVKTWKGDSSTDRPKSIQVQLLQDGSDYGSSKTVTGDAWRYEFTDLPKYKADGKTEHVYTVREVNVPDGYTYDSDGMDITNTKTETPIEIINISGMKIWVDNGNTDKRPSSVEIKLLQDDKEYRKQSITGGKNDDNWSYQFNDLPKDDGQGHVYLYTVEETVVADG